MAQCRTLRSPAANSERAMLMTSLTSCPNTQFTTHLPTPHRTGSNLAQQQQDDDDNDDGGAIFCLDVAERGRVFDPVCFLATDSPCPSRRRRSSLLPHDHNYDVASPFFLLCHRRRRCLF